MLISIRKSNNPYHTIFHWIWIIEIGNCKRSNRKATTWGEWRWPFDAEDMRRKLISKMIRRKHWTSNAPKFGCNELNNFLFWLTNFFGVGFRSSVKLSSKECIGSFVSMLSAASTSSKTSDYSLKCNNLLWGVYPEDWSQIDMCVWQMSYLELGFKRCLYQHQLANIGFTVFVFLTI